MENFAAGVIDNSGKFAAGVIDTSSNFSAGVVDTGGAPWLAHISVNFRKNLKRALIEYYGAWGKLIHEKKQEAKNLVTLSL